MSFWVWPGLLSTSYLIGAVPTAYLVTRLLTGRDIRRLGDGNAGAANVFRSVGPRAGLSVGAVDIAKGSAAVLLVRGLGDSTTLEMLAGAAVVAGHSWPVFLAMRGGRGAATAVGVLLAMLPAVAMPVGALSLVVLYLSRRAIVALAFCLIAVPVLSRPSGYSYDLVIFSVALPLMVGVIHFLSTRVYAPALPVEPESGGERALGEG